MEKKQKFILMAMVMVSTTTLFCYFGEKASCATPAEIAQWLQAHNNYRALHGVPPVTWSATVATSAQNWANTCPSGHSSSGYGENMAYASYAQTPQGVVDRWYSEEPLYDYSNPGYYQNPGTGHFTQVVWKNTTQIGCGCKNGCTGWYSVCVCQYNPPGNVIGQFAANVLLPGVALTLGEAVDNTSLTWTTGGNANWFGQTTTSHHGGDAAESGNIGDSQSSWIQTTVTGPINLVFYWKVSSEGGYDYLKFYIGGVEQPGKISGNVDWTKKMYSISSGTHTVKWAYVKDNSVSGGSDTGWLDKVSLTTGGAPVWLFPLLLD